MIEEQYVSFDTAKLLKEAGFDEVCRCAYYPTGDNAVMHERNSMLSPGYISRPTQALAARWLCERKMIEVSTAYCRRKKSWYYLVGYLDCKDEDIIFGSNYASRQYAMEAGLQEAIKLIKNKEFQPNER